MHPDIESLLPPVRRPVTRTDWGARLAGILCVIFAIIGVLPLALGLVVRSERARVWAAEQTEELLRTYKVRARYQVGVTLWPATVFLKNLQIESNDGKGPALTAHEVSVRPRFFALLSGKLAIAEVEIDSPVIRVVMHGKELANVDVAIPKGKGGPFHAPFDVLSVEAAHLDLDDDGFKVVGREIDVDVTVDDDPQNGSSFEIGVRAGETMIQSRRALASEDIAIDDDDLCSIDTRVRIDPDGILVRRLEAVGAIDLDVLPGTGPGCALPATDARKVELSLSHARIQRSKGESPEVSGFVKMRAPIGVAQRLAHLPETEGWVGLSADVQYGRGMALPDAKGHLEVHDIRLAQFHFAKDIEAEFAIAGGVVRSSETIVKIADGTATLRDVEVRPLEPGAPLKARLDVENADFTTLMSNLGVSNRAHVAWDIRELHAPVVAGTLVPLHIDGDFVGSTANFAVYDRPARDPQRERIIGVRDAQLKARFAVRPLALEFQNVHVQLPKSELSNGFVAIGYHGSIRVDAPHNKIDLDDATPLTSIALAGQADVDLHVIGDLSDPRLSADASIEHFVFGDMPFGNVTQTHVDLRGKIVDIRDLRVTRNKSTYEMPSAKLDFGGKAPFAMDALISSSGLSLRDFLGIFRMDEDPRFTGLDGMLLATADMHLALGGPEDSCGGGFVMVNAKTRAKKLDLFGEVFDDGEADLSYRWQDRLAGIAGADIDIHGITLHKLRGVGPAAVVGSVIGSGSIHRGGVLSGQAVLDAIPLSRLNMLGKLAASTEGAASGVMTMKGTLDEWAAHGAIDLTPLRVRTASLGPSHFTLDMSQTPSSPGKPRGKTKCGAPVPADFDKEAYAHDTSSQGEFGVDGDFFGGQVALRHVTMSRQKGAQLAGDVVLSRLDVAAVSRIADPQTSRETPLGGELSGRLHVQHLDLDDLPNGRLSFTTGPTFFTRSGQKIALLTTDATIAVADDALTIPSIVLALESSGGIGGSATVSGTVSHLFQDAELALSAELAPVDLAVLPAVFSKVERSVGTLTGSVTVRGKASAPEINGALHVKGAEVSVRGLPAAVTDIDVDIVADSSEVRVAKGEARFAGGKVRMRGNIPITKDGFGVAKADIFATDIHIAPADGIATTFNTDLSLTDDLRGSGAEALPHLTGDVIVTAFDYTRNANLELSALGGKSKKTSVPTYDPSLDAIKLEVAIKSRVPFRIKNNLVEASLSLDSGALTVTGTNQLFGVRGSMKVLSGGRFHILANDFDIRQGTIRLDDPTRIVPNVDVVAVTEYRRYTDTTTAAAAGAGAGPGAIASQGAGNIWRITLHAYGDTEDLHLELTSDPPLSQEDIVLLLTVGMTGAEIAQVQAGSLATSAALEAVATASGADRAVKNAIPVIDDFRFGSAYSSKTGRTETQIIVGKHLTDAVRATVATGVGEDQELRATVELRLSQSIGVLGSYDNINDVSSSTVGNIGADLRWHIEFQ